MPSTVIVVLTNCPDQETAQRIARRLVHEGLAACVNILAPVCSVYHWEGKLEEHTEVPLLIKSTAARYRELEAAIVEQHPYSVAEVIALPVSAGFEPYVQWVEAQVQKRLGG